MLQNGQTYSKNLGGVNNARFLKYAWPFYSIMHKIPQNMLLLEPSWCHKDMH